jgi:DNA-directed RNA polymerase specialized sigma24 family protein
MHTIAAKVAEFDPDFLLLNREQRFELSFAVLRYVFRDIESADLGDKFKEILEWTGQDCIEFRKVIKTGYIQKHLKFYVYAAVMGTPHVDPTISREDQAFVRGFLTRTTNREVLAFIKHCKRFNRRGFPPRSLAAFDYIIAKVTPDVLASCRKMVAVKFQFLTQSSQLNANDEAQELYEASLYAMYRAYPEIQNAMHLRNIAITTLHNRGVNKIKSETTQSRNRVIANEDGTFSGTVLSLNFNPAGSDPAALFSDDNCQVGNNLMTGLDGRTIDGERLSDVDRSRDLQMVVLQIENRLKHNPRSLRFLHLLMGNFDEEFSEWLGQPNDEASDRMERYEYANKVREFMGIPVDKARKFISRLKAELSHFTQQ